MDDDEALLAMLEKGGGQMFPIQFRSPYCGERMVVFGLTARDYFAGQALIGLLAMPDISQDERSMQDVIDTAFRYADGMLNKRLQENPNATNGATPPQDAQ